MSIYIQEADPSLTLSVLPLQEWRNPVSGDIKIRNLANDGWILYGNSDLPNLGLVGRSGGSVSDSIKGFVSNSSSFADGANAELTTKATVNGSRIITIDELNTMKTNLLALIEPSVAVGVTTYGKRASSVDNVALLSGDMHFGPSNTTPQTIPLPSFKDGITANEAKCCWLVAPTYLLIDGPAAAYYMRFAFFDAEGSEISNGDISHTRTFSACIWNGESARYETSVRYIIIGIR